MLVRTAFRPRRQNSHRADSWKRCRVCGEGFSKPPNISWAQWESRVACGVSCGQTKPLHSRLQAMALWMGDCLVWQGHRDKDGYGTLQVVVAGKKKNRRAHRLMYQEVFCEDPGALCVMHKCDNPACINPDHLQLGTNAENTADRVAKGRDNPRRGIANGQAKLNEEAVIEIKRGGSPAKLAAKFGVSTSLIYKIRQGRAWETVHA